MMIFIINMIYQLIVASSFAMSSMVLADQLPHALQQPLPFALTAFESISNEVMLTRDDMKSMYFGEH